MLYAIAMGQIIIENDPDLLPLTLKTFSAMVTDSMNISGKFH